MPDGEIDFVPLAPFDFRGSAPEESEEERAVRERSEAAESGVGALPNRYRETGRSQRIIELPTMEIEGDPSSRGGTNRSRGTVRQVGEGRTTELREIEKDPEAVAQLMRERREGERRRRATEFAETMQAPGAEREQWCEQWARQFEQITRNIVWRDEVVVGSQRGLGSRLREHLLPQDRGVVYLRQVLSRELARQRAVPAEDTAAPETKPELQVR